MTKKSEYILAILIALVFVLACEKNSKQEKQKRIVGAGKVLSEKFEMTDFSSVDLGGVANIHIESGKTYSIEVIAYENILSILEMSVVGDVLSIKFNESIKISSDEEIRINITMPVLEKIELSGVGNFTLNGPAQESLTLELSGVGNINAFDLPLENAVIDLDGTGNIEINATKSLNVDIDGLGNVYYKGHPSLDVDISGLGEVIRR